MSLPEMLAGRLPVGSQLEAIAYVSPEQSVGTGRVSLPAPLRRAAVAVETGTDLAQTSDLHLLLIPADAVEEADWFGPVQQWVAGDGASASSEPPRESHLLTLQHVRIHWSPRRIAIIGAPERLPSLRRVVLECTWYIRELDAIERELAENWPSLDSDLDQAYIYDAPADQDREEIARRFKAVFRLRARLARVAPHLLSPQLYPPTLASQVGERLRERLRLEQREEFVSDQIEVFEDVYEMCGQRASEFRHARTVNTLEIIIIVLLGVQILFSMFEILTASAVEASVEPATPARVESTVTAGN
ncbi:MAG: hypothetical protein R3B90_22335 [Planctomycetaceae bacterium]